MLSRSTSLGIIMQTTVYLQTDYYIQSGDGMTDFASSATYVCVIVWDVSVDEVKAESLCIEYRNRGYYIPELKSFFYTPAECCSSFYNFLNHKIKFRSPPPSNLSVVAPPFISQKGPFQSCQPNLTHTPLIPLHSIIYSSTPPQMASQMALPPGA